MLLPFSDSPADRARFARVGRVDVDHGDSQAFGLVCHKVLQLPEGPSMQACTNPFSRFDVFTDMGQVFHANFSHMQTLRLLNDGFGYFVVDVFDMPPLPTRDSPQFPLGGTATVGLETTTMGKVFVSFKPQLPAAKDLATTCGGEIVFPNVHAQDSTFGDGISVRDVQHQVKKPLPLSTQQLRLFGFARGQQIRLVFSTDKRHKLTPGQGEQRNITFSQRIGAMVVMDRRTTKTYGGNRLVFRDTVVRLQGLVGTGDPMDRIAGHLATKVGESISKRPIGQMVQCDTIPTAVFHGKRDNAGTGFRKLVCEVSQFGRLLGASHQFQRDSTFHIGYYTFIKMALQVKGDAGTGAACAAALSLPGMNAGGSRANG